MSSHSVFHQGPQASGSFLCARLFPESRARESSNITFVAPLRHWTVRSCRVLRSCIHTIYIPSISYSADYVCLKQIRVVMERTWACHGDEIGKCLHDQHCAGYQRKWSTASQDRFVSAVRSKQFHFRFRVLTRCTVNGQFPVAILRRTPSRFNKNNIRGPSTLFDILNGQAMDWSRDRANGLVLSASGM